MEKAAITPSAVKMWSYALLESLRKREKEIIFYKFY